MKKKPTREEVLRSDAINHIRRVMDEKIVDADCTTFWYPRCVELFDIYQKLIDEHPEDLNKMSKEDWMIAFARHAYYHAFLQR